MPRRNHKPHSDRKTVWTDFYDVDYVFLPQCPEIAVIVVPYMKTVYRNLSCASWADEVHEVRGRSDKYLEMLNSAY